MEEALGAGQLLAYQLASSIVVIFLGYKSSKAVCGSQGNVVSVAAKNRQISLRNNNLLWIVTALSFGFLLLDQKSWEGPPHIFIKILLFAILLSILRWAKIFRNKFEDKRALEQIAYHVGPGLAAAYFNGFLGHAIKGLPKDDIDQLKIKYNSSKEISALLKAYQDRELVAPPNSADYFCPKLLIIFPESKKNSEKEPRGSILELWSKERLDNENFGLCFERIEHEYVHETGSIRRIVLHVFKLREQTSPDCWRNVYIAVAENRPLIALYNMIDEKAVHFTQEDFRIQFHFYMKSLKLLLERDPACRGKYEIIHYRDEKGCSFSRTILDAIKRIK